jgi:ribosomal protein S12 methylthiotransferase accessory factor YcaO
MMGFGAHLDTRIAINRAMTELNQFIPALLGTNPDGTTHYALGDVDALNWWQNATIDNQPYLLPAEGSAPFRPDEAVPMPEGGVGTLLRGLVDKLEARGHEVLVLDQTRPDVGLPVVKMVVPGLRHFWARFAPGRLYDVPVQMGHLQQPLAETELNPIPMFL